jgi:hypothetical protein
MQSVSCNAMRANRARDLRKHSTTLCPIQGDGWYGAFSRYMLHFLITTIVLHFIYSFISCRSFFFQYYTTVLCLQQLYRGFGFTVEHEKSDRTLYLSELTSAPQSTKSKKQNSLSVLSRPMRLMVTGSYNAQNVQSPLGLCPEWYCQKKTISGLTGTFYAPAICGCCPFPMSTETPAIRTDVFWSSLLSG